MTCHFILPHALSATVRAPGNQPRGIYSCRTGNHGVCSFSASDDEGRKIKDVVQISRGNP